MASGETAAAADEVVNVLVAHHVLILQVVQEQFGGAAKTLVELLIRAGPLTLSEMANELKQEQWKHAYAAASSAESAAQKDSSSASSADLSSALTRVEESNGNTNGNTNAHKTVAGPTATVNASDGSQYEVVGEADRGVVGAISNSYSMVPQTKSSMSDALIKSTLALLVQHRVVCYEEAKRTYRVLVGYALLLRCYYPVFFAFLYKSHGDAAEIVMSLLFQYAVLPWGSLVALAVDRRPELRDAILRCLAGMLRNSLVEFLPFQIASSDAAARGSEESDAIESRKRQRANDTDASSEANTPSMNLSEMHGSYTTWDSVPKQRPCRLNVEQMLMCFFHEVIITDYVDSHYVGPIAAAVCRTFFTVAGPRQTRRDEQRAELELNATQPSAQFPPPPSLFRAIGAGPSSDPADAYRLAGYPERLPASSNSLTRQALTANIRKHLSSLPQDSTAKSSAGSSASSSAHATVSAFSDDVLTAVLDKLSNEDGGNLLRSDSHRGLAEVTDSFSDQFSFADMSGGTGSGSGGSVQLSSVYRFSYADAQIALAQSICESVVFSRHGVLGVHILKLLCSNHFMEDRHLAEESIATHARTRETLHAMLRDGFVRFEEIPKGGGGSASSAAANARGRGKTSVGADGDNDLDGVDDLASAFQAPAVASSGVSAGERAPKHSLFLWNLNFEKDVVPNVRRILVASLSNARARLTHERAALIQLFPRGIANAAATAAATVLTGSADGSVEAEDNAMNGGSGGSKSNSPAEASSAPAHSEDVTAQVLQILSARAQLKRKRGQNTLNVGVSDALLERFVRVECALQSTIVSLMKQIIILEYM